MHILVTGADSQLARALTETLVARPGWTARVLNPAREEPVLHGVETLEGDLRDPEVAKTAVAQIDVIVHLLPWSLSLLFSNDHVERLDMVMRGTRSLMLAAAQASVSRIVLGSTLGLFDRHPAHWHVDEQWRPHPDPTLAHLLPWIGELSVRELVRCSHMEAICLRFGIVVDDSTVFRQPFDPKWVHIRDAVHGLERALTFDHAGMAVARRPDWSVFHIMGAGIRSKIRHSEKTELIPRATSAAAPFHYKPLIDLGRNEPDYQVKPPVLAPWQEILKPAEPVPSRPIRKVVLFGAAGPMGASVIHDLHQDYTLRLADLRLMADVVSDLKAREEYDRIIPPMLGAPHENWIVDVRDSEQVMAACAGMDAIVNCSVLRTDPVDAFRVNAAGAYNMARAAIQLGIRRFVQTGPLLHFYHGHGTHQWDYQIPVEAPGRPYESLYFLSKYLGQEVLRVFAEYYDLEVAVMLFCELVNPAHSSYQPGFFVSWPDSSRAIRKALEVPELPSPFEEFNVSVDLPHGKFDFGKITRILGWQPLDKLDHIWQDME